MSPLIESVHDLSESALKEIKDWLDPWFRSRADSGIREVRSKDRTVTVTRPKGPVVDLSVGDNTGWRFNRDNEGGWGYVQFNDTVDIDTLPDPLSVGGNWGASFQDASGNGLLIGSMTNLTLVSVGTLVVAAADGYHLNASDNSTVGIGVGTYGGSSAPGKTLTFTDHNGNPIATVTG